jgi:hypothetical protein
MNYSRQGVDVTLARGRGGGGIGSGFYEMWLRVGG